MSERVDIRAYHAAAVRERWGRLTPFRIGMMVGETGIGVTQRNPYTSARSRKLYLEGMTFGSEQRRNAWQERIEAAPTLPESDEPEMLI